jgi:hypothetical protein
VLSTDVDPGGFLIGACQLSQSGGVLDESCTADTQCVNGTCDLGRCIDVCSSDNDCPSTHLCTTVPRELANQTVAEFHGCLPAAGDIEYPIPMNGVYARFILPVPGNARSVALVSSVADATQLVGPARVEAPDGSLLYQLPFTRDAFFANRLRTQPTPAVSTLVIPQTPDDPLQPGAYVVELGSYKDLTTPGTDIPTVAAIYKLDDTLHLDLHFYFLDLTDHPCPAAQIDATSAQVSGSEFQETFLRQLNLTFAKAGIVVGTTTATYEDISIRPDLDGLDSS